LIFSRKKMVDDKKVDDKKEAAKAKNPWKQKPAEQKFNAPDRNAEGYEDELPQAGNTRRGKGENDEVVVEGIVDHERESSKARKEKKKKKDGRGGRDPDEDTLDGVRSTGSKETGGPPLSGPNAAERELQMPTKSSGSKNADMGLLIADIKEKRDGLIHDTERDVRDYHMIVAQIERLTAAKEVTAERLSQRKLALEQYDKTLKATRMAYDRLMQTAQNLQSALGDA